MNAAEIAARLADARPGYPLVAFGKVGLPHYRVRLRAQVLERKPIPPIEEIIMLGVARGICDREELRELLGLEEPLFDGLLAELLRKGYLPPGSAGDILALSEDGGRVLADAREIEPATMALEVSFDALLRGVVPRSAALIDARRAAEEGMPEVPPARAAPPELADLDPRAVEREELRHSAGAEYGADLLALRRIDRRSRAFRPAALLVYRSETGEVQVSIALDGEISAPHDQAFATARLSTRAGVRPAAMEHPEVLFEKVFGRPPKKVGAADGGDAPELLAPHAAPSLLIETLTERRRRVLVISSRATPEIVSSEFLDLLRARLNEGTQIAMAVGPAVGSPADQVLQDRAWARLERFYRDFGNFRLKRLARPGPSILARDGDLALLSRFDWLGHEGCSERRFLDERGLVLRDRGLVDEVFESQLARFF
jgi:hypothetical protein